MVKRTSKPKYALGVDYGTNSVRALIVDTTDGSPLASAVYDYRGGEQGILLDPRDPDVARQDPADYIDGFYAAVGHAVQEARARRGFRPDQIVGIGVDTTGSTPIPVDASGTPLARDPRFKNHLAAQAWLWKDHTAAAEAVEITERAGRTRDAYLAKCGGAYSSEWYWAKILHCKRTAPEVFEAAYSWVELTDFVPAFLTGNTAPETLPRGICAAGHKAMYHQEWGGLPRRSLLRRLDPDLVPLAQRYAPAALTADQRAGRLQPEIAQRVGLPAGIPVAVGALDAHMGAVGAGVQPGTVVKIIGTSACDITVWPLEKPLPDIPGLCGIVPGSVLPGMYGLEAGQSAVGDLFHWFVRNLAPADAGRQGDPHDVLSEQAQQFPAGASGLLALDWNNGNRTVLVDPRLSGLLIGQTLHTTAAEIYRALIEATAFGALTIINRFAEYGVAIREVVHCGGIAEKNPLVMQIYADVCNRPMKVIRAAQTCALGSAIYGAVVGGAFRTVPAAQRKMTPKRRDAFQPQRSAAKTYARLYPLYRQLHDAFGTAAGGSSLFPVMKELIAIRNQVRQQAR